MRLTSSRLPIVLKRYNMLGARRQGRGLRTSKAWHPGFYQRRPYHDRSFIDTVHESNLEINILDAFLQDTDAAGKSYDVEQVVQFLQQPEPTWPARIWTECHIEGPVSADGVVQYEHESRWLTTTELNSTIPPPRILPSSHTGIRRNLTFVPELTPNVITTLVANASWFQAQSLRPAVRGHVARKTSISVTASQIDSVGFPVFRLKFHLPFLMLRDASDEGSSVRGSVKKLCSDLIFLFPGGKLSIVESHATVIVSGSDHFDWFGYGFGTLGLGDAIAEEYEVEEDAYACEGEEGTDDWFFAAKEDFFIAGGCQQVASPSQPIMDPRVYFLRAIKNRLDAVVSSHEYLVRRLEEEFNTWIKEHLSTRPGCREIPYARLQDALHSIAKMQELFRQLRLRFDKANKTWDRFSGPRGDILYFEELRTDANARDALHRIEESFERLTDLGLELRAMDQTCAESLKMLYHHLRLGKHGLNRATTLATENAAESAKKSETFAAETSRTSRVSVQLLMITTAVVIALQYFCSDRPIFAFERNPRTFWISISVLVPGLFLLTYALHALDRINAAFADRLAGKLLEATMPQIEPISAA